jgi:hypothetical protein
MKSKPSQRDEIAFPDVDLDQTWCNLIAPRAQANRAGVTRTARGALRSRPHG